MPGSGAATAADLLLYCLQARGVRAFFGMPGTQNIAIYDAFHRLSAPLPHYLARHEQGAAMMANGFARASGQVAAALTVPGPGAANASAGLLDALTDCVPMLLVVGGYERPIARRDRTKMFHGLDQAAFFAPLALYFGCPQTMEQIPLVVDQAFQAMFKGRPGPAVIEVPPDLAAEPWHGSPPALDPISSLAAAAKAPALEAIDAAAQAIGTMQRPVIWVGADCACCGAEREAARLAERLGAPIIYGRRGKGVVPDDHPHVVGFSRSRRAAELLQIADGLIAIGTRFTQIDTRNWQLTMPAVVAQFDRDHGELGREYPITAGVPGDLRAALEAVAERLTARPQPERTAWRAQTLAMHQGWRALPPAPVLSQIQEVLPPDGILSVDVTATGYSCFDRYQVAGTRSLIYPCHSVALGFAFPAAVGAKLACPERPVVSLSGDSGFLMGCFELPTAVEHRATVVAVVVNDGCLTAIRGSQIKAFEGRTIDVSMQSPSFSQLAQSMGARGHSTGSMRDLPPLIEEGLKVPGPTIIELQMEGRLDELTAAIPWLFGE